MNRDRYLRLILTVIALELLWLGVKDFTTPVSAQAAATRVVIAGIEIDAGDGTRAAFVPVGIVGGYRSLPAPASGLLRPLSARIEGDVNIVATSPIKIEVDRPLKVEADRPLPVQNVDYVPRVRPGE